MLAVLLIHAGKPVPVSSFVDELWPLGPPESAQVIVQMCVSGLRKVLAPGIPAKDPRQVLLTHRGSYTLMVPDGEVDQQRFLRLAEQGQQLANAGDTVRAAQVLHEALDVWRGPALQDVEAGPITSAHVTWLNELRAATTERVVRLDLELGRHAEVIAELQATVAADPARETLAAHLITALAAAGRRSEAAAVFEQVRKALSDTIGVRPGPALVDALQRIDPRRPAQLPPRIADFTGRAELLSSVRRELSVRAETPRVLVLCGQGGIGKSALAVRAAHTLRERFPDGQLAADLGNGIGPADVLAGFLRALGVREGDMPRDLAERRQLWCSRTAGARVLVLLDDARGEQQVRALLPSGSGCAALVTSRRRLLGLEGACTIEVPELSAGDSAELLATLAGKERAESEPEQVRRLIGLCGGLPLAVRIVGAKLAAQQYEPVKDLADRIADRQQRLLELRAGDLDVRATVEVSYAECAPEQQRALALLGAANLPTFTRWTVATLTGSDMQVARETVEALSGAQLLQVAGRDSVGLVRYRLHDLIATFGAEEAANLDRTEVESALDAMLAGYLALALRAQHTLRAGRFPPGKAPDSRRSPTARAVNDDPGGWRREEVPNLVEATRLAYRLGWWERTRQLADAFSGLAEPRPADAGTRDVAVLGLRAARRSGDPRAEAVSLCALGDLRWESGRSRTALRYYALSAGRFSAVGDDRGLIRVLVAQSDVDIERGVLRRALRNLNRARELAARIGDQQGHIDALRQLGSLLFDRGDLDSARKAYAAAREIALRTGARTELARADKQFADVLCWCGEYEQARKLLVESFDIACEDADLHWKAHVLRSTGELYRRSGKLQDAEKSLTEAHDIFAEIEHRHARCYALYSLGDLLLEQGEPLQARERFSEGQEIAHALDDWRGKAYAERGLGRCAHALGETAEGTALLRSALALFEKLGYLRVCRVVHAELTR